jgi:hypothetical protein
METQPLLIMSAQRSVDLQNAIVALNLGTAELRDRFYSGGWQHEKSWCLRIDYFRTRWRCVRDECVGRRHHHGNEGCARRDHEGCVEASDV